MAAPPEVPCEPWTTDEDIRRCCAGLDLTFETDEIIQFVSEILFRMSGRQFPGQCTRTIWPCRGSNCGCQKEWMSLTDRDEWYFLYNNYPSWPVRTESGGWVNLGCCDNRCRLERVKLPATINEIVAVWVNGELLDPSAYKIEAYRWLARVDGDKWPCTNDLTGEPGDPNTWTIEYLYGKPVPAGGRTAARIFACEMAKARCGAENCLPARLKEISRHGETMSFADPLEFIKDRETGIYEVDLWLNTVNPYKLQRRSRIHRPDRPTGNTTFS